LMEFEQGAANLVEITLPPEAGVVGQRVGDVALPADTALVTIVRDGRVIVPSNDDPLESGDELLFVTSAIAEEELQQIFGSNSLSKNSSKNS
ncbi:MAG TPA: TrkA C-terminal domain-containing protein, partial [Actinomycetes bacterium]|nr:TrkA C-terminal domain-containing protein [Actinomycetes bacterium]